MTVLGAVAETDQVVLWGDSEVFTWDGKPTGRHRRKVAVNASGLLLGAGFGWCDLAHAAERIVHDAKDFDDACARIPNALRQASLRSVKIFKPDPDSFGDCGYIIAGWSTVSGRALVCKFYACSLFVPVNATSALEPSVAMPRRPSCEQECIELARDQMVKLRTGIPGAGAGHLTVAMLSHDGIFLKTHRDFAADLSYSENIQR